MTSVSITTFYIIMDNNRTKSIIYYYLEVDYFPLMCFSQVILQHFVFTMFNFSCPTFYSLIFTSNIVEHPQKKLVSLIMYVTAAIRSYYFFL